MKKFLSAYPIEGTNDRFDVLHRAEQLVSCSDRVKHILLHGLDRHNRDSLKKIPILASKSCFQLRSGNNW